MGMASVNQTRPHCVIQMGKTHPKPLAARHGHSTLCVNWPSRSVTVGYVVKANYLCMKTRSQSQQNELSEHVFLVRAN
jgi:hypothetical protein